MSEYHSEAALSAIIDIAADGVIALDERFRIVRYNQGAERIFQWTEKEMLGEPLDRLLPLAARAAHRGHMRGFAAGAVDARRMAERRVIAGVRRNGEEFPADASIARVTVDGERTFMVVIRDVSERKRVEDGQQMLAMSGGVLAASLDVESTLATIAEMPLPLLGDWSLVELFSDDGHVRRAAAAHAVTTSGTELAPLLTTHYAPLPSPLPYGSAARVAREGEPVLITDVSRWLDATFPDATARERANSLGAHSVIIVPLRAGHRAIGALSLIRAREGTSHGSDDVSIAEQFGASAALALENTRLYQEARQAVRERDELLAIVSHDLRNPVNAIVMLTGALMAQSDAGAPVQVELEQLQALRGAARQADGLIQDLQDMSRISAGRLRVDARKVDIRNAIMESCELFEATAESADLELTVEIADSLPQVVADVPRVQQVLSNLLVNAIKFTPPGGKIDVRVRAAESDSAVRVSVSDTGPGIDEADKARLFERYWQAPRLLRSGSGLGLFIARGIIEAHRGSITVDSAPGQGTTMSFVLPAG